MALPISFSLVSKNVRFCDVETKKEKRQSSVTKNQKFRLLLEQAIKNEVKFEYILADNWFGAKDNMEVIHNKTNKKFIFGIKSNRLVALTSREKKKGEYHSLKKLNLKDNEKREVYLKGLSFPVSIMRKIFKNEDDSGGTLYLVTNDLESDAENIYGGE